MASPVSDAAATSAVDPYVFFRPGKKRKAYRQRAAYKAEDSADCSRASSGPADDNDLSDSLLTDEANFLSGENGQQGLSVAEALRLQQARNRAKQMRAGGVAFRPEEGGDVFLRPERSKSVVVPSQQYGGAAGAAAGQLVHSHDGDGEDGANSLPAYCIATRFAPQTGRVGDLANRYMEEYVESELAKRKRLAAVAAAAAAEQEDQASLAERAGIGGLQGLSASGGAGLLGGMHAEPQPAIKGKLHEVELGYEARARNLALTERAMRKLRGAEAEDDHDKSGRPKKARLGHDGKPRPPWNRRGSQDMRRDQIVDEFLHENRLDVYKGPDAVEGVAEEEPEEEDRPADDRLFHTFRREFIEAMSQRRRWRPAINAPKQKPKERRDDILRGPKLGGSRNDRQAMREALLQQQGQKRR